MENNSNSGFIVNDPSNVFKTSEYGEVSNKGFYSLCKVKRFGKWFFLKGLQPEYAELTTYKEFLKKEFELEIQLEHPNIVRAISLEDNEKFGLCFTMEYVDGWTLAEFLATNPSRRTKKRICIEILSAMSYFHSMQIIHRDLKPQNILITRKGNNVKIIDFGLSDSDTYAIFKQAAGSDGYAAPEQLDETKDVDLRCDIYAFGKLLNLIFPRRYYFIKQKCTKTDKEKRFNNANEIIHRIELRKPITIIAFCIIIIGLASVFFTHSHKQSPDTPTIDTKTSDTIVIQKSDTIVIKQVDTVQKLEQRNTRNDNRLPIDLQEKINKADVAMRNIAEPILAKLPTATSFHESDSLLTKCLTETYSKRMELLKEVSASDPHYHDYSNALISIQQKYAEECRSIHALKFLPQKAENDKTNKFKQKIEQLAAPILNNLKNNKYTTQDEALTDITQFRLSVREILQSQELLSDIQAREDISAIYLQCETKFQKYMQNLPLY